MAGKMESLQRSIVCLNVMPPFIGPFFCSGLILNIADIIRHLYMNPMFARFAGTRTRAMLDSPWFNALDAAWDGWIKRLCNDGSSDTEDSEDGGAGEGPAGGSPASGGAAQPVPRNVLASRAEPMARASGTAAPVAPSHSAGASGAVTQARSDSAADAVHAGGFSGAVRPGGAAAATVGVQQSGADSDAMSEDESEPEEVADPDPSDEFWTGAGKLIALLFAIFHDGVQLHQKVKSTTLVFSLKCLDLPGFLVSKLLASYNFAFIGGPKEPSCLTEFVALILDQGKQYEPKDDGPGTVWLMFACQVLTCRSSVILQTCALSERLHQVSRMLHCCCQAFAGMCFDIAVRACACKQ